MARTIKIAAIQKQYSPGFKTLESSLAEKGFTRSPGTHRYLMPSVEADGRYRTGLDPKAQYLNSMSEEDRKAELQFISDTLKKLKEEWPDTDFGPRSKVWSPFSDHTPRVSHIPIGNSTVILNPDNSITDLLNYCWVRVCKDVAPSLERYQRGGYAECQYYIANDEAETKSLFSKKKQINKAIVTFEEMTPTRQKQIARLMGLPVSDATTPEAVYNMMDTILKTPEFDEGEYKNMSTLSVFNDFVKMTDERLKVKDLIEQAIRHNIYRKGTGDKIMEGSETVSASKEELANFLLDDNHQQDLIALETRIRQKKAALA